MPCCHRHENTIVTTILRPDSRSLRHADGGFVCCHGDFALAIMPLAFSYVRETRLLRAEYFRGVAMEIVDGEMEILAAGEWRDLPDGSQPYAVHAVAVRTCRPAVFN